MQILKLLIQQRQQQSFTNFSQLQPKINSQTHKLDSQTQRFNHAKNTLKMQIRKIDQLFGRWFERLLKDFENLSGYFRIIVKEFSLLYKKTNEFRPSLLAYTNDILGSLDSNKIVFLRHFTNRSELLQLLAGLLIQYHIDQRDEKIILYTSRQTLRQYEYFYLNFQNSDTDPLEKDFKQQIIDELSNLQIRYFEDIAKLQENDKQSLVVFDLFACCSTLYSAIFQQIGTKKLFKNMLVYTQNQQELINYDEYLEINNRFQFDIVRNTEFQKAIFKIFEDCKQNAQKTDIVIFSDYPQKQRFQIQELNKNTSYPLNIITGCESYQPNQTNIFIATNGKQLASWRYQYEDVIAVFDKGIQLKNRFSIQEKVYIQSEQQINYQQMVIRTSFLGITKPGKYFQMYNFRPQQQRQFEKQQLSFYTLSKLFLGSSVQQILKNRQPEVKFRLEKTIEMLKFHNMLQKKHVFQYKNAYQLGISPFFTKMLLQLKGNWAQTNILVYWLSALSTTGSMKKTLNKNVHNIWKKKDDILSYVQILYICDRQRNKTKQYQSNQNIIEKQLVDENQFTIFGNLYSQPQSKSQVRRSQMSFSQILIELDIQEYFIKRCLQKVTKLRKIFKLKFTEYENIEVESSQLISLMLSKFKNAAYYTGSRRLGYQMGSAKKYLLCKQSILNIYNERPNIILPLKLFKKLKNQPQIILSSKINQQNYIKMTQQVTKNYQQLKQNDFSIQFTGVSNCMFEAICNSPFVQDFQAKYKCVVELSQQIASIIIFCSENNKQMLQKEFNQFMQKTRNQLQSEVKIDDDSSWKIVYQKGGSIKQLVNKNDPRVINLVDLPRECTVQEVTQILENYAELQKIQIVDQFKEKRKTARITFRSMVDLEWAVDNLNYTFWKGKKIKFAEVNKNMFENKISLPQISVNFKWYAWGLTKKGSGIVVFTTAEAAVNASKLFSNLFDGKRVTAIVQQKTLYLQGLIEQTDEQYLESRLKLYGQISEIHLEKQPIHQYNNNQQLIEQCIKKFSSVDEKFQICRILKLSKGLRIAQVKIHNPKSVLVLCSALNQKVSIMGKTRLYLEANYTHPIVIPNQNIQTLYLDFVHQSIKTFIPNTGTVQVEKASQGKLKYLILKSKKLDLLTLVINSLNSKLKEQQIALTAQNTEVYLSKAGMQLLSSVQQKYRCKFVIDYLSKKIGVICKSYDYQHIILQLTTLTQKVMEDSVTCSLRTYDHLCQNPQRLQQIAKSNYLEDIKIDHIGKSIFIKGTPHQLKSTRQAILYYLQNIHSQTPKEIGAETCGICCQYLSKPYRLQICQHTFCSECLMFSINNAFQDISCFPIKCPHCLADVAIKDLTNLLDPAGWEKMTNISLNDYVNKHGDRYTFCFTANCRGIFLSKQLKFDCYVCLKSYCAQCKMDYHPGLTCKQAKDDTSFLLKKYMEENDVRICPNPCCKMLLQRIDGCYRVTCSRCSQSICWKCPSNNMLIFPTADECYRHLTQKHGGYW